jgi:hypothetical protein
MHDKSSLLKGWNNIWKISYFLFIVEIYHKQIACMIGKIKFSTVKILIYDMKI